MKKRIFQYAILLHPTEAELDAGKSTLLLVNPTYLLANDQNSATILAARKIPEEHLDKLDRIEVAVKPF